MDLRERVLAAAQEEHLTQAALAARLRLSEQTVYNWLRRQREEGTVAARPHGGGRAASVDEPGARILSERVRAANDRTLAELGER